MLEPHAGIVTSYCSCHLYVKHFYMITSFALQIVSKLLITQSCHLLYVLESLIIIESAVMSMNCNSKSPRTSYQTCAKVKPGFWSIQNNGPIKDPTHCTVYRHAAQGSRQTEMCKSCFPTRGGYAGLFVSLTLISSYCTYIATLKNEFTQK